MPPWIGYLDNTGSPRLKLSIAGAFPASNQDFEALIDTGFSGFVAMPLISAFPLGLILFGTTTVTLADGSNSPRLTAIGTASIGSESQDGVIILEPNSNDVLIGMDFIKKFGRVLLLHPHKPFVVLEECAVVDAAIASTQPPATSPPPSAQAASQDPPPPTATAEVKPINPEPEKSGS
jgi:predicted aspartyl protease